MRTYLTIASLLAGLTAPALAQEFDLMGFADTNSDGKVTTEEFTAFQGQGWQFASQGAEKVKPGDLDPMMQPMMAGITPDAEGYVTAAAFTAYIPTRFKNADKDGDGALSKAELEASVMPQN